MSEAKAENKNVPDTRLTADALEPVKGDGQDQLQNEVTVNQLVEDFFSNKSEKTVQAYREDLSNFADWIGADSVQEMTEMLLRCSPGKANSISVRHKSYLKDERGLAPSTINRRLSSIRSLTKFAQKLGLINWELSVKNEKSDSYRDTSGPNRREFDRLLSAARGRNDEKGTRDVAIMRLLHDLGLRRSEVVNLNLEHVDLEKKKILVEGKGKNEREPLTVPDQTCKALEEWIEARGKEDGPLFINFDRAEKGDGRLTGTAVYCVMKKYGEKAGVDRSNPHGLRHLAITEGLERTNGNVRAVQQFSRHSSVKTIQIYDGNRKDLGGKVARLVASDRPSGDA